MVHIVFVHADGETRTEADAPVGTSLLDLAQQHLLPLEGTWEGQMACSTCHVIIARDDFDRLPPASEMEEDMLDLAAGARRTSRLACQIRLDDSLDGMTVRIPSESRNMQTR